MRISKLLLFLTCCVCVTLSESVEPASEDGFQQRKRNFPLRRFINAVGWQARKVLKIPQANLKIKNESPYLNPGTDDLHGAFSHQPNVGHITWGAPPVFQHHNLNQPLVLPVHGTIQQNGWGSVPVGVHGIPHQEYHHTPDFKQNGWSKEQEQLHHPPHVPGFKFGWSKEPEPEPHHPPHVPGFKIGWSKAPIQPHQHPHVPEVINGWSTGPQKAHHQQYQHAPNNGWGKGHETHLHNKGALQHGWGWKPRDVCEDLSDRIISSVSDLEPGWRIMRVINASISGRELVDPRILLDPPIKHVPDPPLQLTTDLAEEMEKTFFEEISIDFDESARNAGFSVTRNVFSTTNNKTTSSTRSTLPFGEQSENVLTGQVAILKLKKSATPLRGRFDKRKEFEQGLTKARLARQRGQTTPPAQRFFRKDLLYATELFERILDFEGDDGDEGLLGGNGKVNQLEDNWMEMPTLVGLVEKRGIPDIDHSERTILDVEFNFGLPASSFQFQRVGTTMERWKDMRSLRDRRKRMQTGKEASQLFGGFEGFLESSEDFVRSRMKLHRTFLSESYIEAEERVQKEYVVQQFLICPTSEGPCGDCPLDPLLDRPQLVDWRGGSGGSMRRSNRGRGLG